ncbi:IS1 transposase [Oscillatoria nigro-viridis PCC 7112]|uniref:IS1 transposase n=1 Tax=Phormidium nigroviride PCC 7112 TaxID=179408 RepID=K9VDZ2_9CYAN|nr:IS1 transposase [Oscillatoria nigro-viridis PCC 7112]
MKCGHSFVGNKDNKQWIWVAIDVSTFINCRSVYWQNRSSGRSRIMGFSCDLFQSQCAVSYTDFWSAYGTVFPQKRHKAVGKETGLTNYIEKFNNTMRQRISRLVRKTLSFSKKLSNHIGAIWYFIHEYNASLSMN